MSTKRKVAEQPEAAPQDQTAATPPQDRQAGDEPPESKRTPGPDPFPVAIDTAAGVALLESGRYYDKGLERYAFRNVQIAFDDKPAEPVLDKVRNAGFAYDYARNAWIKRVPPERSIRTRLDAEALFKEVSAMLREAKGLGQEKAPF
jgi:hypothetical protein